MANTFELRPYSQLCLLLMAMLASSNCTSNEPAAISGIYPHLAMFNDEGECGTGAVVAWADRLWVITYAPHMPKGSTDKLYEIDEHLTQTVRPESIGGTPANRMIHAESQQLFIGPYAIDKNRKVRTIPYESMFGRPTGNARHLVSPESKIYYATMEEGLYEVDTATLEVTELWADEQKPNGRKAGLPGYHGKGLYSGQGRIVYANNGEHGTKALRDPETPSGVLAQWDGQSAAWETIRRNQFTEVTGPGGINGAANPTDPIWSIGWDHRSLILMCLDGGVWHSWRLPKASHSYDGAHGWNTEWPRIRDVGQPYLLMTMHGMFWKFPKTFTSSTSGGIQPLSRYLKVIGDACEWKGKIVFGCDDTAKSEFLNKRRAKGTPAAPQSQSNLWFVAPESLDSFGPASASGAVWLKDDLDPGSQSDPFLFSSFDNRSVHLHHAGADAVNVRMELDQSGNGVWLPFKQVSVAASQATWLDLSEAPKAAWIRLVVESKVEAMTALFCFSNHDSRDTNKSPLFDGLESQGATKFVGGTVRATNDRTRTLRHVAIEADGQQSTHVGVYELDATLKLRRVVGKQDFESELKLAGIPSNVLERDAASLIYVDDAGKRWRLPSGERATNAAESKLPMRVCREVATERDLFNAGGIFYELPAENAGGFAKVQPVSTHNLQITDYCSYRGMLVMSGVSIDHSLNNKHLITSDDGKAALWVGAADDLWSLGKPRGWGAVWKQSKVIANQPSDPYLMAGFDQKRLVLSHDSDRAIRCTIECDVTGTGLWITHRILEIEGGSGAKYAFPAGFAARWVRLRLDTDCMSTAEFTYD